MPDPRTAIVRPDRSAPRCAAESTPRARPLTTVRPRAARSASELSRRLESRGRSGPASQRSQSRVCRTRRGSRDTRVPAVRRKWPAARWETGIVPRQGGDPSRLDALTHASQLIEKRRASSRRHGSSTLQAFGQADPRQTGDEREGDGLIACHERLLPGLEPGRADATEKPQNDKRPEPRCGERNGGTRPRCPDYR